MSSRPPDLRLAWCSGAAAKYACQRWHYTGTMPSAGVRIGVWEGVEFAGAILFGIGAGGSTNGGRYGLARRFEVAELVRVALRPGHVHPVSRCVAVAIRMLRRQSPRLRLLISFADQAHGHHGGIYQAGGWLYAGQTEDDRAYEVHGVVRHPRTIGSLGWRQSQRWLRENVDPNARVIRMAPKHRYLYPLDDEIRTTVQAIALPYPKRAKDQAAEHPLGAGR